MNLSTENKTWLDSTWDKIDAKMQKVAVRSYNKIPYTTDENGVHIDRISMPTWWTNGFWGGLMWLLHIGTGKDVYKQTAINAEKIMDAGLKAFNGLHHDVGFMWHIVSGANYRYTGDKDARIRNLYAASTLAARYDIIGKYIIAWNGDSNRYGSIIDCMMNIPLLYWASRETGRDTYKQIAIAHADMAMRDHIRPDGSVNHIILHNNETGEGVENGAGQGSEPGSSWSRGQAWALYGFVLSYIHTGKAEYLDTAKKVANYFISCCCDDWLPRCDFRAPKEPVIYDSTASCCAACGLIEIARNVPENESAAYLDAAINLLRACDENWCNYDENTDYLVGYGTLRYPREGLPASQYDEVHIPIIYGDFFYVEALMKLKGNEYLAW